MYIDANYRYTCTCNLFKMYVCRMICRDMGINDAISYSVIENFRNAEFGYQISFVVGNNWTQNHLSSLQHGSAIKEECSCKSDKKGR